VVGQSVTFTATVTTVAPGGNPTGSVAYVDGVSPIAGCASQSLAAGVATCNLTYTAVGTHSIVGTYTPNTTSFLSSTSAPLIQLVGYASCPLYNQTDVHQAGSTVPIKLQLCDAAGKDMSSFSVLVTAIGLTQLSTSTSGTPVASGNSNPDNNFRFDATLGSTGGYIYNLSTKGLSTGTWALAFTVAGDPTSHSVVIQIR
jgi:Big-like domain-containing protein